MRIAPTTTLSEEALGLIRRVHGHLCPMVLLGARIAKRAVAERRQPVVDALPFGFYRGYGCAVDGIQLFTGCTWGNGNLLLLRGRDFSFILTEEGKDTGVQVAPLPEFLERIRGGKSPEGRKTLMEMLTSSPDDGFLHVQNVRGLEAVTRFPGGE